MILWKQIISGSTGYILTKFSPSGRYMLVDERSSTRFPIAQEMLPLQPILGGKLAMPTFTPMPLTFDDLNLHLIHHPSTDPNRHPKWHPGLISRFSTDHSPDKPTDRSSDGLGNTRLRSTDCTAMRLIIAQRFVYGVIGKDL